MVGEGRPHGMGPSLAPAARPYDDDHRPLFSVGQVADMLDVQQAFLRRLDRHDVVSPARSEGFQRRYSRHDVDRVTQACALVEEGLTLAGIRRVFTLQAQVAALQAELAALKASQRVAPAADDG